MRRRRENDIKAPDGYLLGGLRAVRRDGTILFHRICMGCWNAEADEIDRCGSNNLPETLASYGPPNDFEDGPDDY